MPTEVLLRKVTQSDLEPFFEHQYDPVATKMAAFPSRERDAFMAHWAKIMADETGVMRTITADGRVAGNIVCWGDASERKVGFWLGREFWGQGIASAALAQFLKVVVSRPLFAYVSKQNPGSLKVLTKSGFEVIGEDRFPLKNGAFGEEYILRLGPPAGAEGPKGS